MGVIKQGILGGFSGKVGSVVGTSWKGRAVMKAMPLSVANPRTTGQVQQRTKMTGLVAAARLVLGGSIALLDNPFSGNISGYNRFVKRNMPFVSSLGQLYPNSVKLSEGVLGRIILSTAVSAVDGNNAVTVTWTSEPSPYNLESDKVVVVVMNADFTEVLNAGTDVGQRSTTGSTVISLNRVLRGGENIYIFASAIRTDKKYCSDCMHVDKVVL